MLECAMTHANDYTCLVLANDFCQSSFDGHLLGWESRSATAKYNVSLLSHLDFHIHDVVHMSLSIISHQDPQQVQADNGLKQEASAIPDVQQGG